MDNYKKIDETLERKIEQTEPTQEFKIMVYADTDYRKGLKSLVGYLNQKKIPFHYQLPKISCVYLTLTGEQIQELKRSPYVKRVEESDEIRPYTMKETKEPISDEFRSRLNSLKTDDLVDIIIFVKNYSNLEESLKGVPNRNCPERREAIEKYYEEPIKSVTEYLKGLEAYCNISELLGSINTQINVGQVYELVKQPYIKAVIENQDIRELK
ncbi:MAG: hypothetical protein ISS23_00665 [Nanoarchaeota archaeon]|nr:hypothetical protein [Nanoarchaeota archaeon]